MVFFLCVPQLVDRAHHSVCPRGSCVPQAMLSCGEEEIPGGRAAPEVHPLPPGSHCLLRSLGAGFERVKVALETDSNSAAAAPLSNSLMELE